MNSMSDLIIGGKNLSDFNVHLSGTGTYDAPAPDVTAYSVPGRNGDLLIDNGRYSNITVEYPAFIFRNFAGSMNALRAYLQSLKSYVRIEDSYHPDFYRMGRCASEFIVEAEPSHKAGSFTIRFDCKPQRFLKRGNQPMSFSASGTIWNPTLYDAKPLIRIYGYGTLTVGDASVEITEHTSDYMDLDCDLMDAYCGSTNLNSYITVTDEFPTLPAGSTAVSFDDTITALTIYPRWWTL